MMDWTDRHCRYFLRQCAPHVRLYTEMITTGALLHGDAARHLAFDPAEHPLAAQLGGSEPDELAACARRVEAAGYDEVNLNIGCPSERVQRGAFGACLMAEPELVAACLGAMRRAVAVPVTVKTRIGIDQQDSVRVWWRALPVYLDEAQSLLNRVQGAMDEVATQQQKVRQVFRQAAQAAHAAHAAQG